MVGRCNDLCSSGRWLEDPHGLSPRMMGSYANRSNPRDSESPAVSWLAELFVGGTADSGEQTGRAK
jgi:hypothetical protein